MTCRSLSASLRLSLSPRHLAAIAGLAATLTSAGPALAGPSGGKVVSGNASFQQRGNTTIINAAHNTIINYDSFNIRSGETVRFVQPSETSRVLNRVTGPDPSTIAGTLQSNGIVYISNPAGVFFANGAIVDVGGIYAAAGRISNADFLNQVNRFSLTGAVENYGHITGREVHLLGRQAANFGTIVAPAGLVTMTAGDDVLLGANGGQIMARISGDGGGATGVVQAGEIEAPGGRIAIGAGDMYALAIDHRGRSRANQIALEGGKDGVVSVSGSLDATSANGKGGRITVLGDMVGVFGGDIDASGKSGGGTVLVGGNRMGQGPEPNARAVYTSDDSTIRADAIELGSGGEVILWSDEVSRIYGEISARGGALGGDGGFVETSSARELHVTRTPDVTAARGTGSRGGLWLIDPEDLTIVAGGGQHNVATTPPNVFESSGEGAELGVDLITAALTGGASVEIRTGATGDPEGGTITLHSDADLDYHGTGENTLSLIAHRDIVLDGRIYDSGRQEPGGTGDLLNLVLIADSDQSGVGSVYFNNLVDTGGGSLTVSGEMLTINQQATILTLGGDFVSNMVQSAELHAGIDTGEGGMTFNNPLVLAEDVTLRGGDITFGEINSAPGRGASLTVETTGDGTVRYGGTIGAAAKLGALRTSGDGSAVLDAPSVRADVVDFDLPLMLEQSASIFGPMSIRFGDVVQSAHNQEYSLTYRSPSTTFEGHVGHGDGNLRIGTLTGLEGGTTVVRGNILADTVIFNNTVHLAGQTIQTRHHQTYNGLVRLDSDYVLTAGTQAVRGDVTFNSTVNSFITDRGLTVNTHSNGTTRFGSSVGGLTPLSSLTLNADGTTILAGGHIFTSGDQNYRNKVILEGNTTMSANSVVFHEDASINSGATPSSLTVNAAAGLVRFAAAIGEAKPLESLVVGSGGHTQLDAGTVTTLGAQAYNNATELGAHTHLTASSVSFGRTLDSHGGIHSLTVDTSGDGRTTFGGKVGSITPLTSITTNEDGDTRIFGSITTLQAQTYNNPVRLGDGAITIRGGSVAFMSTIDGSTLLGETDLSVETTGSGQKTFAGDIGGMTALRNFRTNSSGRTRLGGNVTTTQSMTFDDNVVLTGDVTLTDMGSGIIFRRSIDSDGTARSLSLVFDAESNATPEEPELARVIFGGDIGATSALRSLQLGTDRTTNASAATIVGGIGSGNAPISNFSMLIRTLEGVTVGKGQRLSVFGSLDIDAGGTVLLGDITTLRGLNVESPDIAIQTRPAGQMLMRQGGSLVWSNDPGVDIVSGGNLTFSSEPRILGEHRLPAFGTPEARGISETLVAFPQRAVQGVTSEAMRVGSAFLSLRAAGPGNTNVGEAIAGAAPRVEFASSPEEAFHAEGAIAELAALGVRMRDEDEAASLPFLASVHDDSGLPEDIRVNVRRLPPAAVAEVLAAYRTLFYGDSTPPTGEEAPGSRAAHISAVLGEAWADYVQVAGTRADAVGFRAYVEAVPVHAEALHYLNSLRDLFTQMGYLGLTPAELRGSREQIVQSVAFRGLSPAQLESAIMATYMGGAAR